MVVFVVLFSLSSVLTCLGVIKAGFAGDTIPKCIFLNLVGKPKHVRVMAGALEGDNFIGKLPWFAQYFQTPLFNIFIRFRSSS